MENATFRWSQGNADKDMEVMEKDFHEALKPLAASAGQYVMQVGGQVGSAFFDH